ncbi:MAG TPA: cation:proton antiporter, partial [Candidatus Limnocylindrales bacterium]|nr:cation:proton antiporter [Candidatus Limnocylindrales bacterium]
ELTITIVLAYGTYLVATLLGLSGVIATLVAAGAFGQLARGALSRRTTASIDLVWELVAFLLTAFVFLLVGGVIAPASLLTSIGPVAAGIAAVLVARAAVVYALLGASSRLVGRLLQRRPSDPAVRAPIERALQPIPLAWLHVLFWAGLRGAVSVALALSLPTDLPNRGLMQAVTFGIVLFTLLVQGTTAPWIVRRSGAAAAPEASSALA